MRRLIRFINCYYNFIDFALDCSYIGVKEVVIIYFIIGQYMDLATDFNYEICFFIVAFN